MNYDELKSLFQSLNIWRRGSQRAPHKPLLILYALGKCARGSERLIPYQEIDQNLRKLLMDFGPQRKSIHPEYPFWRLQNDGIWVLDQTKNLTIRRSSTDPKKSELIKQNVHGGFTSEIFDLLSKNPKLIQSLAIQLVNAHFPSSMQQDILEAVCLDSSLISKDRNPEFRELVLRAYEYRCAICGLDIRLDNVTLGLEAAHIKWHQAGGPDREDNGLALCVLHHRLFDRGAFTITDDLRLLVSQSLSGSAGFQEWLMRFHKRIIRNPQSKTYNPSPTFILWHQKEVFREPARD